MGFRNQVIYIDTLVRYFFLSFFVLLINLIPHKALTIQASLSPTIFMRHCLTFLYPDLSS